jgi:type II secretory pathway predicted ATPase ExeA
MFEPFHGLLDDPFRPTPDPVFFFYSRAHQRACESLRQALERPGIVLLAGEAGIGKTTTVEPFLRELDAARVIGRKLDGRRVNAVGALQCAGEAFGLLALVAGKRRLLPIVDEAQVLTRESLEELLPLQPLLVGGPELNVSLSQVCRLGPLQPDEVRGYVEQRLRQVGWDGAPRFDDEAFRLIHDHTGGIPQRINLLCRRAFAGFSGASGVVGASAVLRAIQAA